MNPQIILLAVFFVFLVMVLSGRVKLPVAAMLIPVSLEITGVLTPQEAWAGLTNSSVIMMFSMFVVATGFNKTNIIASLSKTVIKPGASDRQILFGLLVPGFLLGCIVNGTMTATIMLPIITAVCAEHKRPLSKFVYPLMALYGFWIGILPLGGNAASYLQSNAIINELGGVGQFTYFTPILIKLPFTIILTLITFIFLNRLFPDLGNIPQSASAEQSGRAGGRRPVKEMTPQQRKRAIVIFSLTLIGVIICALTKKPTWWPSTVGALAMVIFGVMDDREAIQAGSVPIIFLFVGTLPLATAITKTGADKVLNELFVSFTNGMSPFMIMVCMYLVCFVLTQFLQNSTVSNIFRMLATVIAVQNGWNAMPMFLAAQQGTGNSFLMPTANTISVMMYETGGYNVKQWFKCGIVYTIAHFIIFCLYIPRLFPF